MGNNGILNMRRILSQLFLAFAVVTAATSVPAKSQTQLSVSEPGDHKLPIAGMNYSITFACQRSKDLKEAIDASFLERLFATKKVTISHVIIISKDSPTVTASTVDLPKSPLAMINVFSTDGNNEFDGLKLCNQSFLFNGSQRLFIVPILNYSKEFSNGAIFGIIDAVTKVLTPLSPLLGGVPGVAALAGINSSVQQTKEPIQALLKTFAKGKNKAAPVRLFVGVTTIKTRVGTVTVKVAPVKSIVEDPNKEFLSDLRSQLDGITTKPQAGANLQGVCTGIAVGLAQSGFQSQKDIAFSLIYLASKTLTTTEDLLTCLVERKYAEAGVSLDESLFAGYPSFTELTSQEVDNFYPSVSQPSYGQIERILDELVAYLPQYTRNLPSPPPTAASHLKAVFAQAVIVQDKTAGPLGSFDDRNSVDPLQAVDTLASLGLRRFGCYAATSATTGQKIDGAVAQFLMFKADNQAKETALENVYAIRPLFDANFKVAKLILSDRADWIKTILDARSNNCNGFAIVVPKP